MEITETNKNFTWKHRISFGFGDMGLNFFWQGANLYLFYYYTDVIGLPNSLAGVVYAVGATWDAISNPVMGLIADRTNSKLGKYRPYLLFGSIPLALSFVLLFWAPTWFAESMMIVAAFATQILFRSLYTLVAIPYSALGARITRNSQERLMLAGTRMFFAFSGGIVIVVATGILRRVYNDNLAFLVLSMAAAILGAITILTCGRKVNEPINGKSPSDQQKLKFQQIIAMLLKNTPFLRVCGALSAIAICFTFFDKAILYFFQYKLNDKSSGDLALIVVIASQFITIPLWTYITRCTSKRLAWILGNCVCGLGLAVFLLLPQEEPIYFLINCAFIASGLSAHGVNLWAMLPDTVEYGEWRTKIRSESTLMGVVSSIQSAAIAFGALIFGFLLEIINFRAGHEQTVATLEQLHLSMTLFPLLGFVISIGITFHYPIDSAFHANIVQKISARSVSKSSSGP